VGPYTVIASNTTIGERNQIFQFASIGEVTQDLKYHGEPSTLEIGDDNKIREFVSIQRGTEGGGMVTKIGSDILLMNYVHVAHDSIIGDHCILANSTQIAGHCVLEQWVRAMGVVGVHQNCRIGTHAMLAAGAKVAQDVPPYAVVTGDRARLIGVHEELLKRRNFPPETVRELKNAFRTLFFSRLSREDALKQVQAEHSDSAEVRQVLEFIADSKRGVVGRERG
jgi:UDP-N-acetylglucosamine acyltransferase